MYKILWLTALLGTITSPAGAETVTVRAGDCTRLIRHVPAPDVAYLPGVDVQGRPVVPADLDSYPALRPPDTISFDVAVDLRRYGLRPSSPLYEPHLRVGTVRIEADGRVFFNDRPLENPEIAALTDLCRSRVGPSRN